MKTVPVLVAAAAVALSAGCDGGGPTGGADGSPPTQAEPAEPTGEPGSPTPGAGTSSVPEGESPGDGATLVVREAGAEVREDCADRTVIVEADDADVVLDGHCALVKTVGTGSSVQVGSADRIIAVGRDNTVSYAEGGPQVENHGQGDSVEQGGEATP